MKKYLVFLCILIFTFSNVQAVTINEIFPNPIDENNEWIEIYNPEKYDINFSEWMIGDDYSNKSFMFSNITNETYFLIISENGNISEISNTTITFFRVFGKIGNGLSNSGDNITLYNNSIDVDYVTYPSFSKNEGESWAIDENNSWDFAQEPTPGEPNLVFFDNSTENNISTNSTNTTDDLFNLNISIDCDLIFLQGKNNYWLNVDGEIPENCTYYVEYWIEDLFGNIAKEKFTTSVPENARSWTPPEISGSEAYIIYAQIKNITCNETNISDNTANKVIIVMGDNQENYECYCDNQCPPCSCNPCNFQSENEDKYNDFDIISQTNYTSCDSEVKTHLIVNNPTTSKQKYTIYSYIYNGNRLLSTGFDGEKWIEEWSANIHDIYVEENSSKEILLRNKIMENTLPGEYNIRVRIIYGSKKKDITNKIFIGECENETHKSENDFENHSDEEIEIRIPTAEIVSENNSNFLNNFLENIINFFKNILNL